MGRGPWKKGFMSGPSQWMKNNFITRKVIFAKARENVLKKTKGHYQAPLKILDVMEDGQGKRRSSYLSMEAQAFGELALGTQGQNLRHIFFLMDGAKKYPGPKASTETDPGGQSHKNYPGSGLGSRNNGGRPGMAFCPSRATPDHERR